MHAIETFGSEAAFFSARETPWHMLGTVTEEAKTAEDALRIAHLDWTVEKHPVTATVLTPEGVSSVEVPDKFATVRTNPFTGQLEALGIVGKQYTVVQNAENADFLNAIVGESGAHFETAGSLHGGRRVFITMKAPEAMMIGGHDAVDLYLVATNSHDGTTPFTVAATPTRVVCANTLRAGLNHARSKYSRRHTVNATSEAVVEEAVRSLGVMWNYGKAFEATANRMYEQKLVDAEFAAIVEQMFPFDEDATDRIKTETQRRRAEVTDLYKRADTQDGIRGTAWGAYNALTEWADWMMPSRGSDVARAERIAVGTGVDDFKQKALELLN